MVQVPKTQHFWYSNKQWRQSGHKGGVARSKLIRVQNNVAHLCIQFRGGAEKPLVPLSPSPLSPIPLSPTHYHLKKLSPNPLSPNPISPMSIIP